MTTEERVSEWVRVHLGQVLGMAPESVTVDKGLSSYGLDSVDAVLMAGELEDAFGIEIEPARFIACDSLGEIIRMTASDIDRARERRVSE
jgi:acyl carrier protein